VTLRRFPRSCRFPWTFGLLAMWKAMADDPVLLCPCQDGDWCQWCEPIAADVASTAEAPQHLQSAA